MTEPMRGGKILEEQSQMAALATLNQRWAEYCKEVSQKELSFELKWLTRGMAVGFQLAAWRARALSHPLKGNDPPSGDLGFVLAFETILKMATSLTKGPQVLEEEWVPGVATEEAPEPPGPTVDHPDGS